MLVTFKTLKQVTFKVEVNDNESVGNIKKQIQESQPDDFGNSQLKLIYSGKVMEDDKTLTDYKVTEKGFIVVMAQVVKPPPKEKVTEPIKKISPAPSVPTEKSTEETVQVPAPSTAQTIEQVTPTPTVVSPATSESASVSGASALVTGEDFEKAVSYIMEMGFERDQVCAALHKGFNNPERAVEYLLTGNLSMDPAEGGLLAVRTPATTATVPTTESAPSQDTSEGAEDTNPIHLLSQLPQFRQMRALVRQNPQLLPHLIQQLGHSNQDLFNLIQQHEREFLEFLNADDDNTTPAEGEQPPPGTVVLRMTEDEKNAVERLKALGFPEELVVQAYYACDKDEQAAANFLLSEIMDDAV